MNLTLKWLTLLKPFVQNTRGKKEKKSNCQIFMFDYNLTNVFVLIYCVINYIFQNLEMSFHDDKYLSLLLYG